MKKGISLFLLAVVSSPFLSSCQKADDVTGISFKTVSVTVGYTSATVYGTVTVVDNPGRIKQIEVYCAEDPESLKKTKAIVCQLDSENNFSANISSLEDGAKYYFQPKIIVGQTPIEGQTQSFTTFPQGPIDLDLPSGKKWASHNVGAKIPTDKGGHYAWGETSEKSNYNWSSYKYCQGDFNKLTKYVVSKYNGYNGQVDNLTELEGADDAAKAVMGSQWRTPTYKEWEELRENCSARMEKINEVDGVVLYSKKDMNNLKKWIFIPINPGKLSGTGEEYGGGYWTATTYNDGYEYKARYFEFGIGANIYDFSVDRCIGFTTRPIYAN